MEVGPGIGHDGCHGNPAVGCTPGPSANATAAALVGAQAADGILCRGAASGDQAGDQGDAGQQARYSHVGQRVRCPATRASSMLDA